MTDLQEEVNPASPQRGTPVHPRGEAQFTPEVNPGSPKQIQASSSKRTNPTPDPTESGSVAPSAAAGRIDPSALDQPIPRRSIPLLLEVGVDERVARTLGHVNSFRRVFDVVARARAGGARNPGGLVRSLLECSGAVTPTLHGEVQEQILKELVQEQATRSQALQIRPKINVAHIPGEKLEDRLKRLYEEAQAESQRQKRQATSLGGQSEVRGEL